MHKTCTRCGTTHPATLEFFPPHKAGKYGVHSLCIPCKKGDDAARRARPDQKARQKAWRDANKGYTKAYNEEYRKAGKAAPATKRWVAERPEYMREYYRLKARRRRNQDPSIRIKDRMSARIRWLLAGKNGKSTEDILGYTRQELCAHLERQFLKGMSWVNVGEWHVDHIVPVSAFTFETYECQGFRDCWALTNLRPMWAEDNMRKGSKRLYLL